MDKKKVLTAGKEVFKQVGNGKIVRIISYKNVLKKKAFLFLSNHLRGKGIKRYIYCLFFNATLFISKLTHAF